MEDLSWSLWLVYVKLWLICYFDLVDGWRSFMTGLKSYNKTPWPHLYTAVHANRKPVYLLPVVFYSIKLTYVYIIVNTIKKQTADVHCQYSTRYFNLWFCRVNLIVHLLNCLVLAVRDCARIAVNKSFATDRHTITEQSSWTLGTIELLTTWCLQLSWCESYIVCNACNSYRPKKQQFNIFLSLKSMIM